MRLFARGTINAYRECYPEADSALETWAALIEGNDFEHFPALKTIFPKARLIKGEVIVFKIKHNNFRLVCRVNFPGRRVFVKWFGPHKEYDRINPLEVKHVYPPC